MIAETNKHLILLVDDTPENIDILVGLLQDDYDLSVAMNGVDALRAVEKVAPDLILLDVMMPGMSGYEVCKQLKADPKTREIPVVFLTALAEASNEKTGLELGAVDYVVKPFNPSLVEARIANHLALAQARKELQEYGKHLEEIVAHRTHQLADAHEQLRAIDEAKNQFLSAISHELRTPANGILGIGSMALGSLPDGDEKEELQLFFDESAQRLSSMIDSAMHLAQLQSGDSLLELERIELSGVIEPLMEKLKQADSKLSLDRMDVSDFSSWVLADPRFLLESLETLVKAAMILSGGPSSVKISGEIGEEITDILITVLGVSISDELIKTIFEPFSIERGSSYVEELGLRLPVAEKMIRAMGGIVAIKNDAEPSFTIRISLRCS